MEFSVISKKNLNADDEEINNQFLHQESVLEATSSECDTRILEEKVDEMIDLVEEEEIADADGKRTGSTGWLKEGPFLVLEHMVR